MDIKLLDHQMDVIESTQQYKITGMTGGIGSGKTFTGGVWALFNTVQYPGAQGLITAESYDQLMSATLPSFYSLLDDCKIDYNYNGHRKELTINGTKILCRSAQTFDRARGIEVGWWWGDEASYYKREAYKTFYGRLRDKHGPLNSLFTFTPKGFNWIYDILHPSGSQRQDNYNLIVAPSKLNKHLPDGYLESLIGDYDENLAKQELEGEFLNIATGRAYYQFDRDRHVQDFSPKGGQPWIGMDFNVDPMTCIVAEIIDGKIWVYDERFLRNSDTFIMAHSINEYRYGTIVPDSTGSNRKTSGQSDFAILQGQGFRLANTYNPFVIDRVNNLNRLFALDKIIISSKCTNLINDLEKVTWQEGQNKLDQKGDNRLLTHISDCLGYVAHHSMPLKPKAVAVSGRRYK